MRVAPPALCCFGLAAFLLIWFESFATLADWPTPAKRKAQYEAFVERSIAEHGAFAARHLHPMTDAEARELVIYEVVTGIAIPASLILAGLYLQWVRSATLPGREPSRG